MATWTVLALCGSLRRDSYNAALLRLAERTFGDAEFIGSELVRHLPLFDSDLDTDADGLPEAVRQFRGCADRADGVVIATPEYAHGPAGVTKNALDWLVGCGGLVGRPTVLMSASPGQAGGMRAQTPLMPTLTLLGSILVDCVVVSRASTRVGPGGDFADPAVDDRMRYAMRELETALGYAFDKRVRKAAAALE